MKPIDRSIFDYHRNTVPAELADKTASVVTSMRRAFAEADVALREFETFRQRTLADERLSSAGKQQALREWAENHVTKLRQRTAEIADDVATNAARVLKSMTDGLFGERPSDDVADAMLAQEIRSHFRTLDPLKRSSVLQKLATEDRTVLRAALTAPAFLTGVSADEIAALRDDAVKASDPERYARVEALRKGRECTEKALAAGIGAVEKAIAEPIAPAGDRRPLPPEDEQARSSRHASARVERRTTWVVAGEQHGHGSE